MAEQDERHCEKKKHKRRGSNSYSGQSENSTTVTHPAMRTTTAITKRKVEEGPMGVSASYVLGVVG